MEIVVAIVFLILGFLLGRKSKKSLVPKSSEEMEEMRDGRTLGLEQNQFSGVYYVPIP